MPPYKERHPVPLPPYDILIAQLRKRYRHERNALQDVFTTLDGRRHITLYHYKGGYPPFYESAMYGVTLSTPHACVMGVGLTEKTREWELRIGAVSNSPYHAGEFFTFDGNGKRGTLSFPLTCGVIYPIDSLQEIQKMKDLLSQESHFHENEVPSSLDFQNTADALIKQILEEKWYDQPQIFGTSARLE